MADTKATENAVAPEGALEPVDASIVQPSVGEAAAPPAGGVTPSEPAKVEAKTQANKITKPAAKTSGASGQKKGAINNLLNKLMFWKKDKKATA